MCVLFYYRRPLARPHCSASRRRWFFLSAGFEAGPNSLTNHVTKNPVQTIAESRHSTKPWKHPEASGIARSAQTTCRFSFFCFLYNFFFCVTFISDSPTEARVQCFIFSHILYPFCKLQFADLQLPFCSRVVRRSAGCCCRFVRFLLPGCRLPATSRAVKNFSGKWCKGVPALFVEKQFQEILFPIFF